MCEPGPSKRKRTDSPVAEAEPSDECYIHLLPEEILCHIFNLLPFKQQKQCAEVCQRWYGIFRTKPYLRRMKMILSHCFGLPINQFDRKRMSTCLNCLMFDCGAIQEFFTHEFRRFREVLYDNPSDVDCPIVTAANTSVEDFLFSGDLQVKSISFTTTFDRAREHIGERLVMLKNLNELIFELRPPGYDWDVQDSDPEWVIRHPSVTALTLQTYITNGPYRLEMPSLKYFIHEITNDWDLNAMRAVSTQLERLDVTFYFPRTIEQTFTYPFPLLRQLTMKLCGDNNTCEPNTDVDDMSAERFIKSMPLLEEVELQYTIITMKAFRAVCLFSPASLTRLTLLDVKFSRSLFLHVLELTNL
ncbi:uncharacterized protein LOC131214317, partial [Anopheles bellator]|uniref:uncharacterized protein LOC131214317 n=1 Tax=Anopheles bellator TaxID=139047 RepID=UPI00264A4517